MRQRCTAFNVNNILTLNLTSNIVTNAHCVVVEDNMYHTKRPTHSSIANVLVDPKFNANTCAKRRRFFSCFIA